MRTSIKIKLATCCMLVCGGAAAQQHIIPESTPHPDTVYDYVWSCIDGKLIVGNNPFSDEWRCTIIGLDGKPLLKGEYGEITGPDKYGYYSVIGTDGSQMWLTKEMKLTKGKHPKTSLQPQLIQDDQTEAYYIQSARGKRKLRVAKNRHLTQLCEDRIIFGEYKPGSEEDFLYGIMDLYGNVVVKAKYRQIMPYSEGIAMVNKGGNLWGGINKNGKLVIPYVLQKPDDTYTFDPWMYHDGLILVEKEFKKKEDDIIITYTRVGYADKTGRIVIPCRYEGANEFENGKAFVSNGYLNNWHTGYYIDKTGAKTKAPSDGTTLFPLQKGEEKTGFQTYDGKEVLPAVYDDAQPFNGRYALVKIGEHWHLIDSTGNIILRDIAHSLGIHVYPI